MDFGVIDLVVAVCMEGGMNLGGQYQVWLVCDDQINAGAGYFCDKSWLVNHLEKAMVIE